MPWRVFPSDPDDPSPVPLPPSLQGSGRFDVPGVRVTYMAETAAHAVAEKLQRYRGHRLERPDLLERGKPLALVECEIPGDLKIADLCDPAVLLKHGIRPDVLASPRREQTQGVAKALHEAGYDGLRWWSALSGDWHTIVLFVTRVRYLKPEPLTLAHPTLKEACEALGIRA